jgi:drug/metabolite transporter (DMT)-like permease
MPFRFDLPALRGGLLALAAALLFGLSTPLVQRFGAGLGSFTTAALLYAGAAAVGALSRRSAAREARVRREDIGRLALMALFGAVIGPVALAWGLQRSGGAAASLLLTLEAVFTAVLARAWYGEAIDRRLVVALALLTAGGMLLVWRPDAAAEGLSIGLLAVALATLAWGVDNALSRGVAARDPGAVVMLKSALGASAALAIAVGLGEPVPGSTAALALLAVGAAGYGLSLRLYLLAQRAFGAARTGSVFALAPFVGALGAIALGDRSGTVSTLLAALLMLGGIALHLAERHAHAHAHEALAHEHAHRHDDGHHDHPHAQMPEGAHSHPHRHAPVRHAHPHVPDAHHTHSHSPRTRL